MAKRMLTFKAQVKGRKKSSQITGYKVVEEFQFIISLLEECQRIDIVGRWFDKPAQAREAAEHTAQLLGINLAWNKEA